MSILSRAKKQKKGFTLIELMIVIVIMVILAAAAMPIFTGYVKRAREQAAISECRQCVVAAQTIANERAAANRTVSLDAEQAAILALAGGPTDGSILVLNVDPVTAQITQMTYRTHGEITVIYDGQTYRIEDGTNLGDDTAMGKVMDVFGEMNQTYRGGIYDSGAAAITGSHSNDFANELKNKYHLDLAAMGATSWRCVKNGQNGMFLYWTPADITAMQSGQTLPVIRYNSVTGTYTVWKGKIGTSSTTAVSGQTTYNILTDTNTGYTPSTGTTANGNQTYEKAMEYYQQAAKDPGFK